MFGFKEFSADFLTSVPWLVWIGFLGLLALAGLLYYRTNPRTSVPLRILLASLRTIAIVALILALFEPVISYRREHQRARRVSVLIDGSGSMEKIEAGKSRRARVDSVLSSESFAGLRSHADITTAYFGRDLSFSEDKINKDGTGLGTAVAGLASTQTTEPADNWLLLSDGRTNSGRSPVLAATGMKTPVTAVSVSFDVGNFDVALENVDFNPIVFAGQSTDIKATINWQGGKGKATSVRLLDGTRVLAESRFSIAEDGGKAELLLKYVPDQPGQKLLRVEVPRDTDEENEGNNAKTISIKVLKSRLQVLIATNTPDHEVGFLRRHLLQADRYDVDLRVLGTRAGNLAGRFPTTQSELNRFDLVVLYDPDPQQLAPAQHLLTSYLSDRGGAVWVFLGDQFASRGPVDWFNQLLPFYQTGKRAVEYVEFHGEPSEENLFHPAVKLADDRTAIRDLWNNLPPFKSLVRCDGVDKNSQVLAYVAQSGRGDQKTPIIGFRRFGPGKLLTTAALPFWSWGFQSIGFGGDDSSYTRFLEGTTRWLTVRDDFDPIRISPEKDVFARGGPVTFLGYAFDQGYRPIEGVTGSVSLKDAQKGTEVSADLLQKGAGKYQAEFDQLAPGTYQYSAFLARDGKDLKRVQGNIVVEPFSLEDYDQTGDPATLMAVAKVSGGDFYPVSRFSEAVGKIDGGPVTESLAGDFVLWNQGWLLALFIACLTIEWIARKLNQLL
jgi:hypothetical protein